MSLSSLFRKSEWKKLGAFPAEMQSDVAYLLALDSLVKAAVSDAIERLRAQENERSAETCPELRSALSQDWLPKELHIASLSTGVSKTFSALPWVYIPPERVVWVLGILAMCEYRHGEQLTNHFDLTYSGYSPHPDEARAQLLVLIAQGSGARDLEPYRIFDDQRFREFWEGLRNSAFLGAERGVLAEGPRVLAQFETRFQQLSKARKEIVLSFTGAFLKKGPNLKQSPPKPKKARSVEELQKQHPFKFVPYTGLVNEMTRLSEEIAHFFNDLSIDIVELRRNIGADPATSEDRVAELVNLDSETAAYCILVAAVTQMEPEFVGCGVWKKLTESYQSRNSRRLLSAAMLHIPPPQAAESEVATWKKQVATKSLNLLEKARLAPTEYIQTRGNLTSRLRVLLGSTAVFRHVLRHPRYGKALEIFLSRLTESLAPRLAEMRSGELLTWDQQQKLSL